MASGSPMKASARLAAVRLPVWSSTQLQSDSSLSHALLKNIGPHALTRLNPDIVLS